MNTKNFTKQILIKGAIVPVAWFFYTTSIAATSLSANCMQTPTALHTAIATANANSNSANLYTINISGSCFTNAGTGTFTITAPMTLQQDPSPTATPAVLDGGAMGALPATRVISANVGGLGAVLNGLTIQNGFDVIRGGGVYNEGVLLITNSTIQNNAANYQGGGVENAGSLKVFNSSFLSNKAIQTLGDSGGKGGGLNNVFRRNGVNVEVTQCLFANNMADDRGGGFSSFSTSGIVSVKQSTFFGNSASDGSAIAVVQGSISQSTISGNNNGTAVNKTFPSDEPQELDGNATISQSIIANNSSGNIDGPNVTLVDVLQGSVSLDALNDNGGPTKTMKPSAGSAAINGVAADNCGTGNTDQRGAPRPGVGKTNCDVGAYETGNARLVLALPSSGMLDFMTVSGSTTLPVMVQNTGNEAATFSSGTPASSNAKFVGSAVAASNSAFPVLPILKFQDFNVTYSPTSNITDAGSLSIASNANSLTVPMTGTGSGFTPPPAPGVAAILAYINQYSKTKPTPQLYGLLKIPVLAALEVKAYSLAIALAGQAISSGKINAACLILRDAALTVDGKKTPLPDLLGGSAAPGLYTMVVQLRTSLGCKPL